MKLFFPFIAGVCSLLAITASGQGVGISSQQVQPHPSAGLDINFNDRGVLIPRLTQTQRNAIVNPAVGLQIYNTDTDCINLWNGVSWRQACYDCDFALPAVGNNGPICEGSSLEITSSSIPGATYSWTGPSGFSSSLQNPVIPNANASANGLYSLVVTLNGCTSNAITTLATVNATPQTPVAGSNSPVCTGETLSLSSSSIVGAVYSWTGPDGFTSNQQNPVIPDASSENSGVYNVSVSVNGCVSASGSTAVTVSSVSGSFSQTATSHFADNLNQDVSIVNDQVNLPTGGADFGTGADGAFVASSNTTLPGGTYNYSSFTINSGVTVRGSGNSPLIIKCTGSVVLNGILDVSGNDGMSGRRMVDGFGCSDYQYPNLAGSSANPAGGAAVCGGYAGANGSSGGNGANGLGPGGGIGGPSVNGGGGGGGFGTAGQQGDSGGSGGSSYGDAQLSTLQGGSGGGAGAGYTANGNDGGAGGAGGGVIKIMAPDITIGANGGIRSNGGEGGGGDGAGGGGAGGAIWLVTPVLTNNGVIQALGGDGGCASPYYNPGGNGGNGRIRLDYGASSGGGTVSPLAGYLGELPFSKVPGTTVTPVINPSNLCSWGILNYSVLQPSGTTVTVDILGSGGNLLASGVASGTDLSTIPAVDAVGSIKLRATLTTTNPVVTPVLQNWSLSYTSL